MEDFSYLCRKQERNEFHLIAPDFPSFGQTESPSRDEFEYSFDHLAKIVDKFTEAVGLTKFAMYVFDFGQYTFGTPEGSVGPESHHTEIAQLMKEFLGRVFSHQIQTQ